MAKNDPNVVQATKNKTLTSDFKRTNILKYSAMIGKRTGSGDIKEIGEVSVTLRVLLIAYF